MQESSGFVVTFGFALIIIFLALAALFESFRDPLIILVSVPMSIAGALIFISLGIGGATLNIYTEVGLVTLMGLISKHGILIVNSPTSCSAQGKTKREAIEEAAAHPAAPDPDDHRRDGARRHAADHRQRRRRGVALQHGPGDRRRPVDRHAVHAVRGAGGLSGARRGPLRAGACKGDRRFGDRGSWAGIDPRRFDIGVRESMQSCGAVTLRSQRDHDHCLLGNLDIDA